MEELPRSRELTLRAIVLGLVLSIVMGAANVYLGLKAGMTVSASIPAAVISMVILRRVLRNGTILESNQVQTAASAGESLAAGIIFTLPAMLMIGAWAEFDYWMTTGIAMAGGILGILFMIPMRQVFIARGSREMTYPEGVACAEVLRAGGEGEEAAAGARAIVIGGLVGAGIKLADSFMGVLRSTVEGATSAGGRIWYFGVDALPALVAVGYIIRFNIAANLFLGAAISWLIALPLMSGGHDPAAAALDSAYGIWKGEIRFIGVGAMLFGGILTIWRVREGLVEAVRSITGGGLGEEDETQRNLSMRSVVFWSVVAVAMTAGIYTILIGHVATALLVTVIMVIAAFFFTAVASYIVGLVGNSNSPVSGMTITTVLISGLLLLAFGFTGQEGMVATLGVAAIVCCVACTAGDVCNDLKTGVLVGASPRRQQIMEIAGVVVAAFVMAPVLQLLHENTEGGIGGKNLAAPQAALFASLVKGFFGGEKLPWDMIGIGAGIGAVLSIADHYLHKANSGFRTYVMPVAVGMYLPFGISSAIFLGGLLSWWTTRRTQGAPEVYHRGMLLASGLIAGESLMGVGVALLFAANLSALDLGIPGGLQDALTLAALSAVALLIVRTSLQAWNRRS